MLTPAYIEAKRLKTVDVRYNIPNTIEGRHLHQRLEKKEIINKADALLITSILIIVLGQYEYLHDNENISHLIEDVESMVVKEGFFNHQEFNNTFIVLRRIREDRGTDGVNSWTNRLLGAVYSPFYETFVQFMTE